VRRIAVVLSILSTVLILQTGPAYSQGVPSDEVVRKLGRGLVNVATGWFELPMQLGAGMSEAEGIEGLFFGFGKGLVWALLREGAGVYETVTFLIPLPADYEPLMTPPTVFD